jgi:prepilin-type N-terminal cleavage/methylation domain-containing protein
MGISPRLKPRAGYTLVELMMVVMIIAASVLAFAPGFGKAMADRRVSTATRELIRIGRRARSDTFGYLRAHLLWVQPESRRVQLLRGPTPSCRNTDWENIQPDCPANANEMAKQRCLENVDFGSWVQGEKLALREEYLNGNKPAYRTTNRAICFAPTGQVFHARDNSLANARATLSDLNSVNGGVVFTLHAGTSDPIIPPDLVHRVLFPLGGTPRVLR